jgi:hypothetical protein
MLVKVVPGAYYALRHEDMRRSGGTALSFLDPCTIGAKWSPSRPVRFTPGEKAPGTQRTEGWVGPRAGLGAAAKRTISCPCR